MRTVSSYIDKFLMIIESVKIEKKPHKKIQLPKWRSSATVMMYNCNYKLFQKCSNVFVKYLLSRFFTKFTAIHIVCRLQNR